MRILSVEIKNFLSFKGSQSVEFEKGLNLFNGDIGSGKSSLINIISGLIQPTKGKIYYDKSKGKLYEYNGGDANDIDLGYTDVTEQYR